ncbi:MAG: helix-turn-helix domain-containing protein [Candidatus Moranbacteria bacterium]|nr:helix-turn-helix domain-containing protein [Candidatus Moranbacteria bacterium]
MLEKDLQEIGLNEKEARVYLSALELGQSTVQDIAKKALVNRATTYFVIESLMKSGLMSSFQKGKKQYFVAADPDRLIEILEQEKDTIERRKEGLRKLLPQLQSINNKQANRPVVKYYEGKEGLLSMSEELIKYAKNEILMAYSEDAVNAVFGDKERKKARNRRLDNKVKTKVIYTYKDGILESTPDGERRKVPINKFPLTCDIAIYENYVRIASLGNRLVGIVIEDKEIANSFRSIFRLAWEATEKYQ